MAEVIHLKWHHAFVFLFQATLSLTDVVTDAWTCRTYYKQEEYTSFGLGVSLIVVPMIVTCMWSIVASTTRILDEDASGPENAEAGTFFFRGTLPNICLSCFCFGPTLHSLELFFFCMRNFQRLWKSETGFQVTKDQGSLYYLYIHNMNMKMVEGLLESVPQLTLQIYAMLKQTQCIETIQIVSASISFLSLTWMVTSNEELREYSGFDCKFLHTLALLVCNLGLVAGRSTAIIFFAWAFRWWLASVICTHWLIIVLLGLFLWTSKRRQDIVCFCFAYSVFYIFVFRSYMLKKIRGGVPLGSYEYLVTMLWHFLFAAENVVMITMYYRDGKGEDRWFNTYVMILVFVGTFLGIFIKFLMWYFCFRGHLTDGLSESTRPVTIILRDEKAKIKTLPATTITL